MTTRLILNAPSLLQKVTDKTYFPHLVSFDVNKNRWTVELNFTKRKSFYFVNIVVVPLLGTGSILQQLIKYFVFQDKGIGKFTMMLFVAYVLMIAFCWGLNIPLIFYGKFMVKYVNTLLDFEENLKLTKAYKKAQLQYIKPKYEQIRFRKIIKGNCSCVSI